MDALCKYQESLGWFDVQAYGENGEEHSWTDANLFCHGSRLAGFTRLKYIKSSFEALTGWSGLMMRRAERYLRRIVLVDVLPRSIEELCIFDTWLVSAHQLLEVAAREDEKFQPLKSIEIRAWKNPSKATQRPIKALIRELRVRIRIANVIWSNSGNRTTSDDEDGVASDAASVASAEDPSPLARRRRERSDPLNGLDDFDGRRAKLRRRMERMCRTAE